MTVSEKEGVAVAEAIARGNPIILRGAYFNPRFISVVKPIKKGWFNDDFVEQQDRLELSSPDAIKHLPAPSERDQ